LDAMHTEHAVPSPARSGPTLSIVGAGHFCAHFYVIALPPLFPLLQAEFGTSYAALGLLVTIASIATGAAQVPIGFLVDYLGPQPVLALGAAIMSGSIALAGLTSSYEGLLAAMVLVGMGNAVFHPADYAIMTAKVPVGRLGRTYSIHTFAGHVGWAVAPATMIFLATLWDWRVALIIVGMVGVAVALVIFTSAALLDPRSWDSGAPAKRLDEQKNRNGTKNGIRLLLSAPLLLFFGYMILTAISTAGLNSFLVVGLVELGTASLTSANSVLTLYLASSAFGVLLGGVIADHVRRHDLVIAVGFITSAVLLAAVGVLTPTIAAVFGIFLVVGLTQGAIRPSRDMMVRAVAPAGSVGKIFGFVTMGLNVGGALAPILFGWLIDEGLTQGIFLLAGVAMLLALASALIARAKSPG